MEHCPVCPSTQRCVRGHGPKRARIVAIGERPGYSEDFGGLPFIGQSGEEFNSNYLHLAGLTRNLEQDRPNLDTDIYLTNTCKCRNANSNIKPSKKEIEVCGRHWLPGEIRQVEPEVIVLMGGTACSIASDPPINLDTEHGIPRWQKSGNPFFGEWEGWIVPMYHPAAGMHNTSLMIPLLEDWENFGKWLKGEWKVPQPLALVKKMIRLQTAEQVYTAMNRRDLMYGFLPVDTESNEEYPFSVQFSPNPEEGYTILEQDRTALFQFALALTNIWNGCVAMHFALHDLDELERHYGWTGIEAIDTMIDAYHLGNLPQGLKALTYRLTGVRMISYEDVVIPASEEALSNWIAEAIALVSTDWNMQRAVKKQPKTFATKGLVKYESFKHPAEAVLRRVLRHLGVNEENSDSESKRYDPWQPPKKLGTEDEEMRLFGRDWLDAIESQIGRMPRKSIVHATLPKAIEYGCSDAIYTGHCMIRLAERRVAQQKAWTIDQGDEDRPV